MKGGLLVSFNIRVGTPLKCSLLNFNNSLLIKKIVISCKS